ncbi:histidine kinase [Streptomyces sp. NPDC006670]|uniref:sensor histidine kinase n=1 Tax=Streptomyces sp. NPDC006670 TaxID=3154476 RepID=UPI0033FFDFB3
MSAPLCPAERTPWIIRFFFSTAATPARHSGDLFLAALVLIESSPLLTRTPSPAHALVLLAAAALPLRRRHPLTAYLFTLPALWTTHALTGACFTLCALVRSRTRRTLITLATCLLMLGAFLWWRPWHTGTWHTGPWPALPAKNFRRNAHQAVAAYLIATAPVALGLLYRARTDLAARMAELHDLKEREQRLCERAAVSRERNRISREMHDVVSHKATLIAVQAGALEITTTDPHVRQSAATLRTLAVTTLQELRSVLWVLRATEPTDPPPGPPPCLTGLPALVADSRTGATLTLDPALATAALDERLQRTVYRAVQEALTNVRKHAPGAPTTVTIGASEEHLHLRVHNLAPHRPAPTLPGSGLGLLGLRERALIHNGTLEAAHLPDGGFQMTLHLPLTPQHATPAPRPASATAPRPRRRDWPARAWLSAARVLAAPFTRRPPPRQAPRTGPPR